MKSHRHKWNSTGYITNGSKEYFSCRCGAQENRIPTPERAKEIKAAVALQHKRAMRIHKLVHTFDRKFLDAKTNKYKLKGHEFMLAVEKFAKRHPDVIIAACDDAYFSGSRIVYIPHYCDDKKLGRDWMGVSAIYIPQCSGEDPIQYFLYPSHVDQQLNALLKFKQMERKYSKHG